MRLSQALIQRSDIKKQIDQLRSRLSRSARIFEGEQVPENPENLLAELNQLCSQFTTIVAQINKTNSVTPYDDSLVLTDALAERDTLMMKRLILMSLIQKAAGEDMSRYRTSSIKSFSTVNISDIQQEIDRISRRYREIDDRIQEVNWTTELVT